MLSNLARMGSALEHAVQLLLLPRLAELAPRDWHDALSAARAANFDAVEKTGILAALAAVSYLLRPENGQVVELALPLYYAVHFVAAAALLAVIAGPFYLRRLRRGLDQEIERRQPCRPLRSPREKHHE